MPLYSVGQTLFEKNIAICCSTNTIIQVHQLSDQTYFVLNRSTTISHSPDCFPKDFNYFVHLDNNGNIINGINSNGIINNDKIYSLEFDTGRYSLTKYDALGNLLS